MKKALLLLLAVTLSALIACTPSPSDTTVTTADEEDSTALPSPEYTIEEAHGIWESHRQNATDAFATVAVAPEESFSFDKIDGGVRITAYTGDETVVVIPTELGGETVLEIADGALKEKTTLRAVCVPQTVKAIGFGAFAGCNGLTTLKLPYTAAIYDQLNANGESIVDGFFGYIFGATGYKMNASAVPFKLTTVIFTGDAGTVPDGAFYDCNDIKAITLPDGITKIGEFAFASCSSLEYISIGNAVTSIGEYAFNECAALLELHLPATTESIGLGAIQGCGKLTSLSLPFVGGSADENTYLGYIFGAESYVTAGGFFPISLQKIVVLEGCKSIGNDAFNGALTLCEVVLSDGLETIGARAFRNCKAITAITLPDSVKAVGDSAFFGCDSLASASLGLSLTTMGMQAFMCCVSLKSIDIPDAITSIPSSAFDSCTSLESVSFGANITQIGKNAFRGCASLTSVPNVAESVRVMDGNPAFIKDTPAD